MTTKDTILIVDDELAIGELLRDFLEAENYQVFLAADSEECFRLLEQHRIDCILLDIMLPGQTGFDICKRIRQTNNVPILFLSALDQDLHIIRGLGIGGDDYITKNSSPGEIVARVKAVLRRSKQHMPAPVKDSHLDFGSLKIDVLSHEVWLNNEKITFTAKEFELLRFLAEHANQVFTHEQLYESIWGDYLEDSHLVRVYISRIREKIEEDPSKPEWIQTVWGVGYKFSGK
ncbi:response regulator transcription factor [Lihuaxuella thermophila]|uniref:DNA-binding response regulator, OmpR family, contains REC and winged-helix (WHTH) domain n=1 Tax=Lihuaxuella thermophila TaxID=1173111 RepID=A0A1H8G6G6_9BACL|nr:response regulator transcription factor [Lihuaxuella thermophila]SEN39345.1 DNA-binding response regulator, OmpR family, contains REC and winged-helix (wHTH) domain [Lihuaxuella thermophila]